MENQTQDSIPLPTATNALRLASSLLQEHPSLLMPPLLMLVMTSALVGAAPSALTVVSLGLLNLAVTGGWYSLILIAARKEPLRWDDFLAGVGRHFYPLVSGTMLFFCAMMAVILPLTFIGLRWAGDPRKLPLAQLQQQVAKGNLSIAPQWMDLLTRWSVILLVALAVYALLSYFLLLWNQVVVLERTHWIKAWAKSARMAIQFWKPLCAILTVNGLAWLVAVLLKLVGGGFAGAVLASFASLVAEIYFRTAYTTFTFLALPPPAEAAEAE
ncbi:MAG: hypothetical protein ACM3YO_07245 [Bacteroidota bacterium]